MAGDDYSLLTTKSLPTLKRRLDSGRYEVEAVDSYSGLSVLISCIRHRPTLAAQLLLAAGADPNRSVVIKDVWTTPLHEAVIAGFFPEVVLLVENGANLDAQESYGTSLTPLMAAISMNKDSKIAEYLILSGADPSRPCNIITEGYGEIIGCTPLYLALLLGKLTIARALLRRCAPVNEKTGCGGAPLVVASWLDNSEQAAEAIDMLLDVPRVDVNIEDSWDPDWPLGRVTPLMAVCIYQSVRHARRLVEMGARTRVYDGEGNTLLICAIARPDPELELVKWLVEEIGVDVNERAATSGKTPIMVCAENLSVYSFEIAVYLIQKGADLTLAGRVDGNNRVTICQCAHKAPDHMRSLLRRVLESQIDRGSVFPYPQDWSKN